MKAKKTVKTLSGEDTESPQKKKKRKRSSSSSHSKKNKHKRRRGTTPLLHIASFESNHSNSSCAHDISKQLPLDCDLFYNSLSPHSSIGLLRQLAGFTGLGQR